MQHLALSHPSISFKFIKDGTESLHTPGDGKLSSAVYAALGRDFARGLVSVEGHGGETAVSGFVTAPLQGRGSRSMQVFFVNGRFIKSQLLTAALEEGYRNQIMKGRFPGCVLAVTLPAPAVDGVFGPNTTLAVRSYQQLVGLTPNGYVDETTWNSIYGNFALADYFLRRDTVRAQSLRENAVPVMAQGNETPPARPERWDDTPRVGQYPGSPVHLGQKDGGEKGQRGVKI